MLSPGLWRGSLLPLACAAGANPEHSILLMYRTYRFGAASRPSGSKLPRHRPVCYNCAANREP
ncbi:hypothetical protein C1X64_16030 [Pseudomonas sp. GW456-E7]|nr:hypothetical protein C1X64_16030 [Pseudomonas sp. GW456-E7]